MNKRRTAGWLALCMLALSACALAAPTQDFDDFLVDEGLDPTDAQVQSHMLTVGETREALDVALTVEGVPVTAYADHPVSRWWPSMFGLFVAGDPINSLMGRFRVEEAGEYDLHGEAEVTAKFTVKRPDKPIAVVDPEIHVPYDDEGTETDRLAMVEAMQTYGVTIAGPDEMDVAPWKEQGYLTLNRYGQYIEDSGNVVEEDVLIGLTLPDTQTEEVEITFVVDFDALR